MWANACTVPCLLCRAVSLLPSNHQLDAGAMKNKENSEKRGKRRRNGGTRVLPKDLQALDNIKDTISFSNGVFTVHSQHHLMQI